MSDLLNPLGDMVRCLLLLLVMLGLFLLRGLVHDLVLELLESFFETLDLLDCLIPGLVIILGLFDQALGLLGLGLKGD